MKVAIIVPYRNDRPLFLDNLKRMLKCQTYQNFFVQLINDVPVTNDKDITWRYRKGYEATKGKGYDAIMFMEVDDWYRYDYIETMLQMWQVNNMPTIFGTNYTIYYSIGINKWFTMHHSRRSSAMSTLIKPNLDIDWCADNDPYTDVHLWKLFRNDYATFEPDKHICLGIKHGVGLTGGRNHNDHMHRYINDDNDKSFLRKHMDAESFNFYSNYKL